MEIVDKWDSHRAERVGSVFRAQPLMQALGVKLVTVSAGEASLQMSCRNEHMQHHGVLHGGVVATLLDAACGAAAFSLMLEGEGVVVVEFKVNFLEPAVGIEIAAIGKVKRAGNRLVACVADAFIVEKKDTTVATMLATLLRIPSSS